MEIIGYKPEFKEAVRRLNYEWLERYFEVEPRDVEVLSDPENEIIGKGGLIYFAIVSGEVIGTVSLLKVSDSVYELSKMAVTQNAQGSGIGRKLLDFAIQKARGLGIGTLILYSNTQLQSAIHLYRTYGFEEIPLDPGLYKRADIKMQLNL